MTWKIKKKEEEKGGGGGGGREKRRIKWTEFSLWGLGTKFLRTVVAVSYTHLDVYKRQT